MSSPAARAEVPAPDRPMRPADLRQRAIPMLGAAAWVLGVAGLSLSRQSGIPAWRTLWAEDAAVFLHGVWSSPPGAAAVVEPYAGYVHAVPRLLAIPAAWFHASYASAYMAFAAALVYGLVTLAILRLTGSVLQRPASRAAIAASPVLLPAMIWENLNNVTYLLWLFLYAGFWALVAPSRTRGDSVVRAGLLVLGALSHPLLGIYMPIAAYVALRRRQRGDRIAAAALTGALAVQAFFTMSAAKVPAQGRDIAELGRTGLQRVVGSAVLGERGLELGWERWGWAAIAAAALTLLAILAALAVGARRRNLGLAAAALVYAAVALGAALYSRGTAGTAPVDGIYVPVGARYFVVPVLLIWAAVAVLADDVLGDARSRRATAAAAALAVVAIATGWQPANLRSGPLQWPADVNRAGAACHDGTTTAVVAGNSPPGWLVEVPCRELR